MYRETVFGIHAEALHSGGASININSELESGAQFTRICQDAPLGRAGLFTLRPIYALFRVR